MAKPNSRGLKADLSACVRVVLAALGLGGLVLVLSLSLLVQLYIRDSVALQSSGLEGPSIVILVPLQASDSLSAVLGYLVYELILLSEDVSSTVLVEGRGLYKVDEVDVGVVVLSSELLVELLVPLQVQLILTGQVNLELEVIAKGHGLNIVALVEVYNLYIVPVSNLVKLLFLVAILGTEAQGYELSVIILILQLAAALIYADLTSQVRGLDLSGLGQCKGYSVNILIADLYELDLRLLLQIALWK